MNSTIPLSQAQRETLEALLVAAQSAQREYNNFLGYVYREKELDPSEWVLRNTATGFERNHPPQEVGEDPNPTLS